MALRYAPTTFSVLDGMSVLAQPNHPARIAALLLGTIAFAGIVGAALISVLFVVADQRDTAITRVASDVAIPDSHIEAPEGLVVVTPVETTEQFRELAGFEPFVPETLPASTDLEPKFAVAQPDESGLRVGRVAYSAREGWSAYGVSGPVIVIGQAQGAAGDGVDGELKRIVGAGRALVATLACGPLVLDVQMYFSPEPGEGEEIVTPYMRDVAIKFLDSVREQCAA
jgi:hypothetical protein